MKNIKQITLAISLSSLLLIGCGSSNSTNNDKDTNKSTNVVFNKAYYKSIDYSNIDQLSTKFLGTDPRFVNLSTQIQLPVISVQTADKNYTIDKIEKAQFDNGTQVLAYESKDLVYQQYQEGDKMRIDLVDKANNNETLSVLFDEAHVSEIPNPKMKGTTITTYASEHLTVVFPDAITVNGSVSIDYNSTSEYAIIQDGALGLNTFNKLVDITQNYPNIKTIVLKNIDGSVHDDINMQSGLLLRKAGLNTYVVDTEGESTDIASGAVDLFISGAKREIENNETVSLGIHSWAEEGNDGKKIEGRDFPKEHKKHHDQLLYFGEMLGVDKGYDFYFHTLEVSEADDIHPMSKEELIEFDILK